MSESNSADTQNQAAAAEKAAAETVEKNASSASAASGEANSQQTPPPASGPTLEEQLATALKQASDFQAHYVRAMADLDNYRKRAMREKDEIRQYGSARILEDLLPAIDNLSLGLGAAKQPNADPKTIVGGVEMVLNQLKTTLASHGLKEINPLNQPFDPHQHESISHLPSNEVPAESVVAVVRSGFMLNGRLIRPASVVVSSGPAQAEAQQ